MENLSATGSPQLWQALQQFTLLQEHLEVFSVHQMDSHMQIVLAMDKKILFPFYVYLSFR